MSISRRDFAQRATVSATFIFLILYLVFTSIGVSSSSPPSQITSPCSAFVDCWSCSTNSSCYWTLVSQPNKATNQTAGATASQYGCVEAPNAVLLASSSSTKYSNCPVMKINVTLPSAGPFVPTGMPLAVTFDAFNLTSVYYILNEYSLNPQTLLSRRLVSLDPASSSTGPYLVQTGKNRFNWSEAPPASPMDVSLYFEVVSLPNISSLDPLSGPYTAYGRSPDVTLTNCRAETCAACVNSYIVKAATMDSRYACSWDPMAQTCRTQFDVQSRGLPTGITNDQQCINFSLDTTSNSQYRLNDSITFNYSIADRKLDTLSISLVSLANGNVTQIWPSNSSAATAPTSEMSRNGTHSFSWQIPTSLPVDFYFLRLRGEAPFDRIAIVPSAMQPAVFLLQSTIFLIFDSVVETTQTNSSTGVAYIKGSHPSTQVVPNANDDSSSGTLSTAATIGIVFGTVIIFAGIVAGCMHLAPRDKLRHDGVPPRVRVKLQARTAVPAQRRAAAAAAAAGVIHAAAPARSVLHPRYHHQQAASGAIFQSHISVAISASISTPVQIQRPRALPQPQPQPQPAVNQVSDLHPRLTPIQSRAAGLLRRLGEAASPQPPSPPHPRSALLTPVAVYGSPAPPVSFQLSHASSPVSAGQMELFVSRLSPPPYNTLNALQHAEFLKPGDVIRAYDDAVFIDCDLPPSYQQAMEGSN